MNIGYVNIYSFRPHVEHLMYLKDILSNAGHESFFLTCDSSVDACYARSIKGSAKIIECSKCIAGGVRSFPVDNIKSIKSMSSSISEDVLEEIALSSSCTLHRTESELEWYDEDVANTRKKMHSSIAIVLENAKKWIVENQIDAVICFNGRMDLTKAVTYACEELGVPYITHERTWFGDGLTLVPNGNCLSLAAQNKLVMDFKDKPLTISQAKYAGKLAGERFLQRNSLEWRLYNKNPEPVNWPINTVGKRILVLPSSKNEFAGHEDWLTGWTDNTKAIDDFLDIFGFSPNQVVVRCHPNWSENIGRVLGIRSINLYKKWAEEKKVYLIGSDQKASTYDLIQQADIVIMNGGSSAVEAGVCGKQVICLGPAPYEYAGFVQVFKSHKEMEECEGLLAEVDPIDIVRKTLRFLYVRSHRFPQYVKYVHALETTKYEYFQGANSKRIEHMLATSEILPDDDTFALDTSDEDVVVEMLIKKSWGDLAAYKPDKTQMNTMTISRRFALRWIDSFRGLFARGDR